MHEQKCWKSLFFFFPLIALVIVCASSVEHFGSSVVHRNEWQPTHRHLHKARVFGCISCHFFSFFAVDIEHSERQISREAKIREPSKTSFGHSHCFGWMSACSHRMDIKGVRANAMTAGYKRIKGDANANVSMPKNVIRLKNVWQRNNNSVRPLLSSAFIAKKTFLGLQELNKRCFPGGNFSPGEIICCVRRRFAFGLTLSTKIQITHRQITGMGNENHLCALIFRFFLSS